MEQYTSIKNEIHRLNSGLSDLLLKAQKLSEDGNNTLNSWQAVCRRIEQQLSEQLVRVALIGTIKSGKSTLANALFQGDYLKRGAGVVTSMVTRVRHGDQLRADLTFKSWGTINDEIRQALILLPGMEDVPLQDGYDLRDADHRARLKGALAKIPPEQMVNHDTRNANALLLSCYLKGFEQVRSIIKDEPALCTYGENRFAAHRNFVADETLAVYLDDVALNIDFKELPHEVEIADCQGSDAINPLHLSMIQDHLNIANFAIYVISSRTGLRQADYRFLSIIKKMGIIDNLVFVVNCDFSEHDSRADLNELLKKLAHELSILKPQPEIYVFSALYNLFKSTHTELTGKDKLRLQMWEEEASLGAYSDQETQRFAQRLKQKLIDQRARLLMQNHLDRLRIVNQGLGRWADMRAGILSSDQDQVADLIARMQSHRDKVLHLEGVIKSTLNGASGQMEREMRLHIDRFFGDSGSGLMGSIVNHVRNFQVNLKEHRVQSGEAGFNHQVYLLFQEFRHDLDGFIAESINPEVIRFIREKEKGIEAKLMEVASTYYDLIEDALADFHRSMDGHMTDTALPDTKAMTIDLDLEGLKTGNGIMLGAAEASMRLTAKIKAEAVMRLGLHSVAGWLKKVVQRKEDHDQQHQINALSNLLKSLKLEAEQLVLSNFTDYRENVKFKYLLRLIRLSGDSLCTGLVQQFAGHVEDLEKLMNYIGQQVTDKQEIYHRALLIKEETVGFDTDLMTLTNEVMLLHE